MAEYSIEPWGDLRNDMMIAQLCYMVYLAIAGKKGHKVDIIDFMPFLDLPKDKKKRNKQSPEIQQAIAMQLVAAHGKHSKSSS